MQLLPLISSGEAVSKRGSEPPAGFFMALSNMTILQSNVAAAVNKMQLSEVDKQRLERYSQKTAPGYCAGCADICEAKVNLDIPVSDILRYSMYNHSYGDRNIASRLFNELSPEVKANIPKADYSMAEKYCPQKIQIGKILKKAHEDLT